MEPLKSLDFNQIETMRNTPDHFNRDQIISLAMIIIPVIYILVGTVYPKEAPGHYFFTFMGNSWIWVLMCAIGALIRRKDSKQSIVPIHKCLTEASMWTMISLVGALVMLGKVTSDANLGIRTWLVEVLSPLFGGANIWVLMAIVILFSTLVTQIANGLVLTMAVWSGCYAICLQSGCNHRNQPRRYPDYIEYLLRLCFLDRCSFHQRSLYSWPPRDHPEVCLDKGRSNDSPVHGYLLHLRHGIYLHSVIIIVQHSSMEWVDKALAHSS